MQIGHALGILGDHRAIRITHMKVQTICARSIVGLGTIRALKSSFHHYIPIQDWILALLGTFTALYGLIFHQKVVDVGGLTNDVDKWFSFIGLLSLVLGMGVPSAVNYIVVSSLLAGVVVELGAQSCLIVPLITVHLFVFYFGIVDSTKPPFAQAASVKVVTVLGEF